MARRRRRGVRLRGVRLDLWSGLGLVKWMDSSGGRWLFVLHLPALMVVFDCFYNVDINMARVTELIGFS